MAERHDQGEQQGDGKAGPSAVGRRKLIDIAAASAGLLLDTEAWIHRRVYKISYTDAGLMQTKISIDLTLDDRLVPYEGEGKTPSVFFAPILMLRKWPPLMRFDVRSPSGDPLPLLTSVKNREVDAALLESLAPPGSLREAVGETMREIATSDKARAQELVRVLGDLVLEASPADLDKPERDAWVQTLFVASSLASNSLLWARVEGRHGDRTLVKVAFEDPTRRELVLSRRVLASFSWAPTRLVLPFPNAGDGRSLHIQIDPPPEMRIHRARLLLANPLTGDGSSRNASESRRASDLWWAFKNTLRWRIGDMFASAPSAPSDNADRLQPEERVPSAGEAYWWETPERAYLYARGPREQAAVAEVDLAVHERNGLKSAAVGTAAAIAGLLTYFLVAAAEVTRHVDAAVTLLVLVPVLLGYLVVRPGEHPLLRKHLWGVRLLLLIVGATPVIAASSLLGWTTPTADKVFWYWLPLVLSAWLITGLLVLSRLLPLVKDPYPGLASGSLAAEESAPTSAQR